MNSKAIIDLTFDDGASYAVTLRAGETKELKVKVSKQ